MATVARQDFARSTPNRRLRPTETTWTIILFLLPTLVLLGVFVIWPIVSSFQLSLYDWDGLSPTREFIGLENWTRLRSDNIFWKAFRNNFTLVTLSLAIQMPLGVGLAVLLEQGEKLFIFKIFKTVYFFPMLMSSVAIGILFKYVYDPVFGIINPALEAAGLSSWTRSWLGDTDVALFSVIAVVCWQYTPFYMILYLAALRGIPTDLRDAAFIDGAGESRYYWSIALPQIQGTIRTAIVLSLIGSLKYFDLIWVMTEGGPSNASELMATYMYKKAFPSFDMGYGSTIASAMFIIVMLLSLVLMVLTRRFETEV
ncbi:MAG: sugar ABC transporter permease [Chloroflexi bacterium]|nr:sugar ABC transporter permease [Chloroflexota bacterium]